MVFDPHGDTRLKLDVLKDAQQPGEVFYLNNSGVGPPGTAPASNSFTGTSPLEPLSTLAGARGKCTASRCDTIMIYPGHSETVTAAIALSVAGVTIIGVGNGTLKPTFIGNAADDVFNVSGNNVTVDNVHFGAPLTDAQTSFIDVVGTNCTLRNISGVGSVATENVVDCITVTATADDLLIEDLYLYNSVVAVNSFISLEGAASRVTLRRCYCFGDVATAGMIDAAKIDYLFMEDVQIGVVGTTKPAATLDSNPEGMARNCFFAGTHATLASNAALGNLMRLDNIKVLEETDASTSAAIIPAVDTD